MKQARTGEVEHRVSRSAPALGTLGLVLAGGAIVHFLPGAVAWRSARCRLLPALSGVGRLDHIALTFDDGPDPRSTPKVLEALDSLGWRATFFVLGGRVREARGLTKEIVARGHEIGIHGDQHTSHLRRPATWTVPDVRRARDTVEEVTGESHGGFVLPTALCPLRRSWPPAGPACSWSCGRRGAAIGGRMPPAGPWRPM